MLVCAYGRVLGIDANVFSLLRSLSLSLSLSRNLSLSLSLSLFKSLSLLHSLSFFPRWLLSLPPSLPPSRARAHTHATFREQASIR